MTALKLYQLKEKTPCVLQGPGWCIHCDSREQAINFAKRGKSFWRKSVYCSLNPGKTFWLCHPGQEGRFVDPTTGPHWQEPRP